MNAIRGPGTFGVPYWVYLARNRNRALLNAGLGASAIPVAAPEPNAVAPEAALTTEESKTDYTALVSQLAPVATSLINADATKNVEVLKAKVQNATAIRDRLPQGGVAWTFANNRVNVLKGKLKAAKKALAREREDRAATKQWGVLGKAGLGVAILGGLALTVTILKFGAAAQRYKGGRP